MAKNTDPRKVADPAPAASPAPASEATPADAPKSAATKTNSAPTETNSAAGSESSADKTIYLNYEFQNSTPLGIKRYGPGEVTVPADVADDLMRRNQEHMAYRESVHVRDEALMYAGTIHGNGE